jgi:hypothetical protein
MIKFIMYVVLIVFAYFAVRTYAQFSLGKKMMVCSTESTVNLKGANRDQMLLYGRNLVICVDSKTNFVDRLFFDKQEALDSIQVN